MRRQAVTVEDVDACDRLRTLVLERHAGGSVTKTPVTETVTENASVTEKRGRPRKTDVLDNAERQRRFRAARKAVLAGVERA